MATKILAFDVPQKKQFINAVTQDLSHISFILIYRWQVAAVAASKCELIAYFFTWDMLQNDFCSGKILLFRGGFSLGSGQVWTNCLLFHMRHASEWFLFRTDDIIWRGFQFGQLSNLNKLPTFPHEYVCFRMISVQNRCHLAVEREQNCLLFHMNTYASEWFLFKTVVIQLSNVKLTVEYDSNSTAYWKWKNAHWDRWDFVNWFDMGLLRLVCSLKLQVSFAKEPYKRDDILQKRPIIVRSLVIVATPCGQISCPDSRDQQWF